MENNAIPINNMSTDNVSVLSQAETKMYLTPFAFKIDNSLFGLPLATPKRRGFALLIDLFLVALLSDIPGVLLALAIAITLYYLGNIKRARDNNKIKGRKRSAMLRFIAAFMVFIILLSVLPTLFKYIGIEEIEQNDYIEHKGIPLTQSLSITLSTLQKLNNSDCNQVECWKIELSSVASDIAKVSLESDIKIEPSDLNEIFVDIVQEIDLPLTEREQLIISMHANYNKKIAQLTSQLIQNSDDKLANSSLALDPLSKPMNNIVVDGILESEEDTNLPDDDNHKEQKTNKQIYSIIEWGKGIINDLGLGFGWAMFYFTVSIALGKGQTLGKKLLKIKVIQLDGTPLSLWDSFGRYGGYGAGLATGLLGFIQIYWDPNKQAIHDKISATVVIDLNKTRLNE